MKVLMVTPILNRRFFQEHPPSPAIFQKWREFYEWSDQIMPVYEWDDVVYVGCLQLPTEFPVGPKKVVFCLCDMESLSITWERFNGLTSFIRSPVAPIRPIGPMKPTGNQLSESSSAISKIDAPKKIAKKPLPEKAPRVPPPSREAIQAAEEKTVVRPMPEAMQEKTVVHPLSEATNHGKTRTTNTELAESPTMMILSPEDFGEEVNEATLLADLSKLDGHPMNSSANTVVTGAVEEAKTAIHLATFTNSQPGIRAELPTDLPKEKKRPELTARKVESQLAYEPPDFGDEPLDELVEQPIHIEPIAFTPPTPVTTTNTAAKSMPEPVVEQLAKTPELAMKVTAQPTLELSDSPTLELSDGESAIETETLEGINLSAPVGRTEANKDPTDISFESLTAQAPGTKEVKKDDDDFFGALEATRVGANEGPSDSDPFSAARSALVAEGIDLTKPLDDESDNKLRLEKTATHSAPLAAVSVPQAEAIRATPMSIEPVIGYTSSPSLGKIEVPNPGTSTIISNLSAGLAQKVDEGFLELKGHFQKSMLLLKSGTVLRPYRWDEGFNVESPSQDSIPMNVPSPFRVVDRTQRPYHGYVVGSELNDRFFLEWNGGQTPEHVTITPLIVDDHLLGMMLSVGEKTADSENNLHLSEKVTKDLSEYFKLEAQSTPAAS